MHDELDPILRQDLPAFIEKSFGTLHPAKEYKPNWHVEAMAHALNLCADGRRNRQLICVPPRNLKSLVVSVAWPVYLLGHNPSLKIICVSYGSELSDTLGRNFRKIVRSPWYRRIFPGMLVSKDTEGSLETTAGGMRHATSISGALTGLGGDIIIVDDPLKAEQALSDSSREAVHSFYSNTLLSRLNNKVTGTIVIVMQRIHDDDLAGRQIASKQFHHLILPAIATEHEEIPIGPNRVHTRMPGDLLHPEREPLAVLEQMKLGMGSAIFQAQYQQAPIPAHGNMINVEWLASYDRLPSRIRGDKIIQSWDTAMKGGERNDYSVCTTWLLRGADFYLMDVLRRQMDYPALVKAALEQYEKFRPNALLIEDKGSGTSLLQDLTCLIREGDDFGLADVV
jgi:hypothetical protein